MADIGDTLDRLQVQNDAEGGGFVVGFVLGLVVGVLLALVLSPWKGEETRELVVTRAGQLKDQATDLVSQVRGEVADEVESA
jgi:gas vesicle protein